MKLRTIAFRNISRNRRRSLLCIVAVAIAAMSMVLLFNLLTGMKADMRSNIESYFTGQVRVRHREFDDRELLNPLHLRVQHYEALMARIEGLPASTFVVPRTPFPAFVDPPSVGNPGGANIAASGVGVDFAREEGFQEIETILSRGRLPEPGRFEMLIGTGLAQKLGKEVGDSVTILTTTMRRGANAATFTVTGLASFKIGSMNQGYFYIPLDRAQHILGMGDSVIEVLTKFEEGVVDQKAVSLVTSVLDPANETAARDWKELNIFAQYIDIADIAYGVMGLIFFILASTVIVNSIMMIIFERMREIGTIGALGMEGGEIVRLFFLEAFYLASIGAAAGTLLGILITLVLSVTGIDFGASMQGVDIEISDVIYPRMNLSTTLFAFLFAILTASLTSLIPTRRAAKIKPVEALRHV